MNPITHALTGWCLEKALITIAAIAPDVDGLGMFAELPEAEQVRAWMAWGRESA